MFDDEDIDRIDPIRNNSNTATPSAGYHDHHAPLYVVPAPQPPTVGGGHTRFSHKRSDSDGTPRSDLLIVTGPATRNANDFELVMAEPVASNSDLKDSDETQRGCCRCLMTREATFLERIVFGFSISTLIFLGLLAIHCFILQISGLAIPPLVAALVFLYLVFLQKKNTTVAVASGTLAASLLVLLFTILVLVVWGLNWKIVMNPEDFQDMPPHVWGCPNEFQQGDLGPLMALRRIDPEAQENASSSCIVGHSFLGAFALCAALSALVVLIASSLALPELIRRKKRRNSAAAMFPPIIEAQNGTLQVSGPPGGGHRRYSDQMLSTVAEGLDLT